MSIEAVLLAPDDLAEAGALRHGFFVVEKGWVGGEAGEPELDAYDAHAVHFGVRRGGALIGYMRALRGDCPTGYMLDHDFRACLGDAQHAALERAQGVELSRRVVAPDLDRADAFATVELLFQAFAHFVLGSGLRAVYLVQEPRYTPMLARMFGLPFVPLNPVPHRFPDGTVVDVVGATTEALMEGLRASGRWDRYREFLAASPLALPPVPVALLQAA